MVHALETVHNLLSASGHLIDIHPLTERAEFQVRIGEVRHHAGWLRETDEGIEYRRAESAQAAVVAAGLFVVEQDLTFTFLHHGRSLAEMQEHLARTWKDAIIDDDVARRVQDLLDQADGVAEVILREEPRMTRLSPASHSLG